MSTTVTFYTSNFLANSPVVASANPDTNKQNVLDKNLNTYWQPGLPAGGATIVIDTHPQAAAAYDAGRGETSGSYDAISTWIGNYNTDYSSYTLNVYHTVHSDGTGEVLLWTGVFDHLNGPLFFVDLDTAATERYVRLSWVGITPNIDVGSVLVHEKRTIQTRPEYPIRIQPRYWNTVVNMGGGKEYTIAQALNYTSHFDQTYTFSSVANKTVFDNVFHDSNGRLRPLIYQPGTTVSDAYLCYLNQDVPNVQEIDHEFYKATLKFKTLPFIEDGKTM